MGQGSAPSDPGAAGAPPPWHKIVHTTVMPDGRTLVDGGHPVSTQRLDKAPIAEWVADTSPPGQHHNRARAYLRLPGRFSGTDLADVPLRRLITDLGWRIEKWTHWGPGKHSSEKWEWVLDNKLTLTLDAGYRGAGRGLILECHGEEQAPTAAAFKGRVLSALGIAPDPPQPGSKMVVATVATPSPALHPEGPPAVAETPADQDSDRPRWARTLRRGATVAEPDQIATREDFTDLPSGRWASSMFPLGPFRRMDRSDWIWAAVAGPFALFLPGMVIAFVALSLIPGGKNASLTLLVLTSAVIGTSLGIPLAVWATRAYESHRARSYLKVEASSGTADALRQRVEAAVREVTPDGAAGATPEGAHAAWCDLGKRWQVVLWPQKAAGAPLVELDAWWMIEGLPRLKGAILQSLQS